MDVKSWIVISMIPWNPSFAFEGGIRAPHGQIWQLLVLKAAPMSQSYAQTVQHNACDTKFSPEYMFFIHTNSQSYSSHGFLFTAWGNIYINCMLTRINCELAKMALFRYPGNYFKNLVFLCIREHIIGMIFQISQGMSNVPIHLFCAEMRPNLQWFPK